MKILLTGANGFLGYYLTKQLLKENYTVVATGKAESRFAFSTEGYIYEPMDFTDPFAVHDVFEKYQPEVVIHSGAISKPDECEKDQWQAYVTNVEGTVTMLTNAEAYKSFFIFLSTDFIFSGEKGMYTEEDEPGPVNYYGQTKLEAEEAIKEYSFDWSIVRTVLVYGSPQPGGKGNILSVVKEKLEKGEEYSVFNDQLRTPTHIDDLVNGIIAIINKQATGVYHLSGEEVLTPFDMACRLADHLGLNTSLIKKVTAGEFVQPAKRPAKTGFDISKAKRELGFQPISFEEGLVKIFPG
jgi:dTDP-4-dehydrorhamnose reductase